MRVHLPELTVPLPFMIAMSWDVLLPGAAVASITDALSLIGGESTVAGKQDALSCRINLPAMYDASSWKAVCGWKSKRLGT